MSAKATTFVVGPSERFRSISEAVAVASPGDTILIRKGTYAEGRAIEIHKSITILGIDWPVIDGQYKSEVISVRASHVTISGLRIIKSGISSLNDPAAIGAEDADFLTIIGNRFDDNFFGIHLANCHNVEVTSNILRASLRADHESGNGIHLWKCSKARIVGNNVVNHRDGIYFEFVTESSVEENVSEGNQRYGLHFMFSHHDSYKKNVFRNNGAGVAVMYTNYVEMYDNIFEDNWGDAAYGLLLKDISDSYIEGNTFSKNSTGILLEGVNRGNFTKNIFKGNGWAIKLQANCEGNSFTRNNFLNNTFDLVTNGRMVLNAFQYNYWDRYEGYDLNKDGVGDVPFRPVSMYSMVIDRIPTAVMLWRSFLVLLLECWACSVRSRSCSRSSGSTGCSPTRSAGARKRSASAWRWEQSPARWSGWSYGRG
jgi:nitrous oxidase accessory protein